MRAFNDVGEPGTIVLVTAALGRYGQFEASLSRLHVPSGTTLLRLRGSSSAASQNLGIEQRKGKWVWFIDDDHIFEPDVLLKLLAHNVDIVAPLVPMRLPPYGMVLYKKLDMEEDAHGKITNFVNQFYSFEELNGMTGLIPVQGLPKAGCLIRERVWEMMPKPIFKIGVIHPDQIEDDKYFMWEVREKYKIPLWCDTDQVIEHISTVIFGCRRTPEGEYKLTWRPD
jgi:hypothetical protein